MAEAGQKTFVERLKRFQALGMYSDFVITCRGDEHKVHKIIVCSRADFFERALRFGGQEAASDTIDLPEDDPEIIKLLIQYLYEGDYECLGLNDEDATAAARTTLATPGAPHTCPKYYNDSEYYCALVLCKHHSCRDFYNSQRLGTRCCANFVCEQCYPARHGAELLINAKMYEVADKYNVLGLKEVVKDKFTRICAVWWNSDSFPVAAHHVFTTTPDQDNGLRDIVIKTISDHASVLVDKPAVEVLLRKFNDLTFGLAKVMAKRGSS